MLQTNSLGVLHDSVFHHDYLVPGKVFDVYLEISPAVVIFVKLSLTIGHLVDYSLVIMFKLDHNRFYLNLSGFSQPSFMLVHLLHDLFDKVGRALLRSLVIMLYEDAELGGVLIRLTF